MTTDPIPEDSTLQPVDDGPTHPSGSDSIFEGPNGLRAGWRILIFLLLFLAVLLFVVVGMALIPPMRASLVALQAKGPMTPIVVIIGEGSGAIAVLVAAILMSRIERRPFAVYGLPFDRSSAKLFMIGLISGFVALTVLIGLIAARHGYSIEGLAISSGEAIRYGLAYAFAFLLVGIFEEFTFRGYLQYTLASGTGFWAAAFILAIVFGAAHLTNPGEAKFGALMAAGFGLVAVFSLHRTGSLWFAIAMHTTWDWGETFFYSVPDSGMMARGHLLNAAFHGPKWLTGGSVGPEGSIFVFPVLVFWAVAIHFMFPARESKQ